VCSAFSGRSRPLWRLSSLSWALFFIGQWSCSTSLLFIQSLSSCHSASHEFLSLPFCLLTLYACRRDSHPNKWPNQFFCLCRTVFIKLLFSSTMSRNSWLGRCSVQLIFINLLQIHISNDSSLWMSTFLNVHASSLLLNEWVIVFDVTLEKNFQQLNWRTATYRAWTVKRVTVNKDSCGTSLKRRPRYSTENKDSSRLC